MPGNTKIKRQGPLLGLKIVELAGIGPAPFAAMLMADLGAEIIRVDRRVDPGLGVPRGAEYDLMNRSRQSIAIDLKNPEGAETVLKLLEKADVIIDPFRPGVTEKLGIGPDQAMQRNGRLIYARMTGFGNEGPSAHGGP